MKNYITKIMRELKRVFVRQRHYKCRKMKKHVFVSGISYVNRKERAPLWMNVKDCNRVVGVDFCDENEKILTVSIFWRSDDVIVHDSHTRPITYSQLKRGGSFRFGYGYRNYQEGGFRLAKDYDITMEKDPRQIVKEVRKTVKSFIWKV